MQALKAGHGIHGRTDKNDSGMSEFNGLLRTINEIDSVSSVALLKRMSYRLGLGEMVKIIEDGTNHPLPLGRPTWAEVNQDALLDNYRVLDSLLVRNESKAQYPRIIPVIKAHAYGHGMNAIAHTLADAGVSMVAVGVVEEGIDLRQAGIAQDILILGTTWAGQEAIALENRLILSVDSPECVFRLEASSKGTVPIPVHIKVDTGMSRLGASWDAIGPLLDSLRRSKRVSLKGVFSHLSSADERDPAFTLEQIRRFECSLAAVRESELDPGEIHFANSAGLLYHEKLRQWSARTGLALYGYPPDPDRSPVKLRPVLALKTKVAFIRMIEAGESVGYGRKFKASGKTRIAILPIGYADGFSRKLGVGRGKVIVRDSWAEIVGAVSMDMITIDITNVPDVQVGDEAILLGSSAHCHISAADWAEELGTIPYEILCRIAPRIPRIYVRDSAFQRSMQ
jgi:alanine racemase